MPAVCPGKEWSPSRARASGSCHSNRPSRGLYPPTRPCGLRRGTEAAGAPATNPPMPVEGLRAAIPSRTGATTLLQPGVPPGRAAVVAPEGPAKVRGNGGGPGEAQRAEPALPRACAQPQAGSAGRDSCGGREGNQSRCFSGAVATAPTATKASPKSGDLPASGSVRARADAPWNGSGSASDAGAAPSSSGGTGRRCR